MNAGNTKNFAVLKSLNAIVGRSLVIKTFEVTNPPIFQCKIQDHFFAALIRNSCLHNIICAGQTAPSGKRFLWIKGGPQHTPTLPGTDAAVNLDGYISITPLRCDLTAHDTLADLTARLG